VVTTTAKASDLTRSVEACNRLALRIHDAAFQIGFQPAQRFARQDIQLHPHKWSICGIKDRMGFGRAQQSVTTIVTRSINRDHLGVFGKGVGHLGIAGGDLCVNMIHI
jgi:hypothetical protein